MNETSPPTATTPVAWSEGFWRNRPVFVAETSTGGLLAEASRGSDAWQKTSYGFVRDSEHGLLRPFDPCTAVEVSFIAGMAEQFDQAGVILRTDSEHWVKAGTEFADGMLRLSVVATNKYSDWSTAPIPEWSGKTVTVRASLADDALTIRAKVEGEQFNVIRLIPFATDMTKPIHAGPYLCAPSRSGFQTQFTSWRTGPSDRSLH